MKKRAGYSRRELQDAICRKVMSGQISNSIHLFTVVTPEKDAKQLKKALKASENWHLDNLITYNIYGVPFQGLSSWGIGLTVRMGNMDYRFKTLHLDRFGQRFVYAIPVQRLGSISELPGILLSRDEIRLVLDMADELRTSNSDHEYLTQIKKPARGTIKTQAAPWKRFKLEEDRLLSVLEQHPLLLDIAVTVLDAQLRSFKKLRKAPMGISNYLLPSGDAEAGTWLLTALGAMTLTNEPSVISHGVIEVEFKDASDLKRWESCYDRLTVIRTATGSLLRPLVEQLEEHQRIQKSGGDIVRPFSTAPIALCKSVLHCPQAIDLELPKEACPLTDDQKDLLRLAMVRLLKHKTADSLYQKFQMSMARPFAYRFSGLSVWRSVLAKQILGA